MNTSTRQKIINYLLEHREASAPELSQALNMTRPNMRYHIERLLREGIIELVSPALPAKSRGRPILMYLLAVTARPDNLIQLAHLLLENYNQENEKSSDLQGRMRNLAQRLVQVEDFPRAMTQRLNWLIQILNQKNYQARWEARVRTPIVLFRNCPYAAILPDHPELCLMDAYLLEHLSGVPFVQQVKMDIYSNRSPACIFALTESRKSLSHNLEVTFPSTDQ